MCTRSVSPEAAAVERARRVGRDGGRLRTETCPRPGAALIRGGHAGEPRPVDVLDARPAA